MSFGKNYYRPVDVAIRWGHYTADEKAILHLAVEHPQQLSAATLLQLPLPAVHYQLGPMPLLEALMLLAGPDWKLRVDPIRRSVCYAPRPQGPATLPLQKLAQ